jgi:glutamate synthase (NADPH/NADH) small chain
LAQLGFEVTCFEKKTLGGGLDTYGIVVFREPVEVSLSEVTMIEELGVDIRNNVEVGKEISFDELIETYDAVFVAIGLGTVPKLGIKGESLPGVHDGLEFIEKTKTTDLNKIESGTNVVVVGAGNTAIDCATIAKRLGAQNVTIVYRRSQSEMPAYHFEYEFALREGVNFRFLSQPFEIVGKSKVEAIRCHSVRLGEPDQSGRRSPEIIEGSEVDIACDTFILAIGQNKRADLSAELIKHNVNFENGYIAVDAKTNKTANEKIFAGGDCVRAKGEASTVMAVEDGKKAAQGIFLNLIRQDKNRQTP